MQLVHGLQLGSQLVLLLGGVLLALQGALLVGLQRVGQCLRVEQAAPQAVSLLACIAGVHVQLGHLLLCLAQVGLQDRVEWGCSIKQ